MITSFWTARVRSTARAELSEDGCYEALRRARWPGGVICPHCGVRRVTTHSRSTKTPRLRYLCLACRRTFTDLAGTPFAGTKVPLATWFLGFRLVAEGRTTSELAKELAVKWDTAAHLAQRLSSALGPSALAQQLRQALREAGLE